MIRPRPKSIKLSETPGKLPSTHRGSSVDIKGYAPPSPIKEREEPKTDSATDQTVPSIARRRSSTIPEVVAELKPEIAPKPATSDRKSSTDSTNSVQRRPSGQSTSASKSLDRKSSTDSTASAQRRPSNTSQSASDPSASTDEKKDHVVLTVEPTLRAPSPARSPAVTPKKVVGGKWL